MMYVHRWSELSRPTVVAHTPASSASTTSEETMGFTSTMALPRIAGGSSATFPPVDAMLVVPAPRQERKQSVAASHMLTFLGNGSESCNWQGGHQQHARLGAVCSCALLRCHETRSSSSTWTAPWPSQPSRPHLRSSTCFRGCGSATLSASCVEHPWPPPAISAPPIARLISGCVRAGGRGRL